MQSCLPSDGRAIGIVTTHTSDIPQKCATIGLGFDGMRDYTGPHGTGMKSLVRVYLIPLTLEQRLNCIRLLMPPGRSGAS